MSTTALRARLSGRWAWPLLLGLAALVLRLYQLGRNPLWLDELFEVQVSLAPWGTVIRQAWFEAWPPLYHIISKLASGAGLIHAAWAWRYSSVLAGTLVVVGLYWLLRELAGETPAVLISLLTVLSPTLVFFSQEARAYSLMTLGSTGSTLIVWRLAVRRDGETSQRRWYWLAWIALSLFGFYLSYSYALVWALQCAYLLWIDRAGRQAAVSVAITALGFVPLLPWLRANMSGSLVQLQATAALTPQILARTAFGGDPNRYGHNWGQVVLVVVLGALALAGLWHALRQESASFGLYLAAQVALPVLGYFGVAAGLLHTHLPAFEAKQFIVLLPAFYALAGFGMRWLFRSGAWRLGPVLGCGLWAVAVIGCLPGLQSYWTVNKSPEGELAIALSQSAQPGDAVVSLHYSLDAALSFYGPAGVSVFAKPLASPHGYSFSNSLNVLYNAQYARPYQLADIRRSQRIWVLFRQEVAGDVVSALAQGCTATTFKVITPFEILQLDNCPPV